MKKIYKRKSLRRLAAAVYAALTAGTLGFAPVLYANPTLDSKDAAVSISGLNTSNVNITSEATNNVIKWVEFSIGSGEKVAFDTHNYLNYVTGHARSDILGTLTGGGSIYLVNPNGILIGDNATINVGNLYLSTKSLTAEQLADYTTATSALSAASIADGDVINLGKLDANSVTVEGKNITFKNVADVTSGATLGSDDKLTGGTQNNAVTLTANSDGEIHIGSAAGGASGYTTNGTTYNYKLVSTKEELQNMQNNLDGKYMLADDIADASLEPIKNYSGRFDGLNHKLSNLTIKLGDSSYGGLFGANYGTIENLEINGITFTDATGAWDPNAIGAVVGYNNYGTIKNVRNTGSMTLAIDRKVNSIGGIAGINDGTIENVSNAANISYENVTQQVGGISGYNSGKIVNAVNSGDIEGTGSRQVGGISGYNYGKIVNAVNSGDIEGTGSEQVGGIVGSNFSEIEEVSNTGSITGNQNAGGIAGTNYNGGKIETASNAGSITGNQNAGGIVGSNSGGGNIKTASNTGSITGSQNAGSITGTNEGIVKNTENTGTVNGVVPDTPTVEPSPTPASGGGNGGTSTPTNPTTPTDTTPTTPSGGNTGSTTPANPTTPTDTTPTTPSSDSGNTGSTTPTNPTTPTEPTPIAPSGNTDSTTPNSGGNTSGTGANPPAPLAAAERVIVATVTETETIAAAATAGATAEMSHIADNVSQTSLTEQPTNSGENAAAAPLAAAVETAENAQDFTLTAGGLLAVSNETNSAPKDAMSVESIGHALSTLQHGSGEKSAATAPNTETKSAAGSIGSLDEAVEATDLAIGTEIAETDRESNAGQENLASDTGTAGGDNGDAEESKEKKKQQ